MTVEKRRKLDALGDFGVSAVLAAVLPIVLPMIINKMKDWFSKNPKSPTPQELAVPINQGQYQDKKSLEGYIYGVLANYPADIRQGVAAGIWDNIKTKTPEIALGFRAAARKYEDLKPLVKQGAFGPETFMEKYGKALIITGVSVGVLLTGVIVYKIVQRRRGG